MNSIFTLDPDSRVREAVTPTGQVLRQQRTVLAPDGTITWAESSASPRYTVVDPVETAAKLDAAGYETRVLRFRSPWKTALSGARVQEAYQLASIVDKRASGWYEEGDENAEKAEALVRKVRGMEDPVGIVAELIALARVGPDEGELVTRILSEGGRAESLDYLEALDKRGVPFDFSWGAVTSEIRERVRPGRDAKRGQLTEPAEPVEVETPTEEQILDWRRAFEAGPTEFSFHGVARGGAGPKGAA